MLQHQGCDVCVGELSFVSLPGNGCRGAVKAARRLGGAAASGDVEEQAFVFTGAAGGWQRL